MQKIVSHQNVEECAGWMLIRTGGPIACRGARWITASISLELNRFILINCAESVQVCKGANFFHPSFSLFPHLCVKSKWHFFPFHFNKYFWCRLWYWLEKKWWKDGMLSDFFYFFLVAADCILNRLCACCCQWSCSHLCSLRAFLFTFVNQLYISPLRNSLCRW